MEKQIRILLVHSINTSKESSRYTFVREQAEALQRKGCEYDYFGIKGKGVRGYLSNLKALRKKILEFSPDIIHAHYGLSGALCVLQRKVPVVITYHNGETLSKKSNIIASITTFFSTFNIFVAEHIYQLLYLKKKRNILIQPCGIELKTLNIVDKEQAKRELNLPNKNNILFGGSFENKRKNVKLANNALKLLDCKEINFIEMKGWSRREVNLLLCACDMMLLTTKSEGSPQVVKEALACNCPIVATDVADIANLFGSTANCYLTSFDPNDVAKNIKKVLDNPYRTNGRERIDELKLDNDDVAETLIGVYKQILNI